MLNWDRCPICNGKMKQSKVQLTAFHQGDLKNCVNGCFSHTRELAMDTIIFFGEKGNSHIIWASDRDCHERRERIQKKIDYWKENDRYLIKLLSK